MRIAEWVNGVIEAGGGVRNGSGDCPVSSLARSNLKTSPEVVHVKPPETAVAIAAFATKR
jgi:hypothetical protein